jgi:hypothetical protein
MKKKYHKMARQSLFLGNYVPYYAYPPIAINVHKIPPVSIQKGVPIIWNPRLMHDKYAQFMPPIVIKIASDYIGRFITALLP